MSRYLLRVAAVVLLSLSLAVPSVVAAQDATPSAAESLLTALGYPELHVTITDTAIEAPAEVPAGLTLLTVENTTKEDTGVFLIAPPAGVSIEVFRATAEATPLPGATPGAEEEFPSWFYDAILSGGPSVGPSGRGQIVIDLQPGDWAVASEGNQEPSLLTVTEGATPAPAAEPTANLTVDLQEYAITIPQQVDPGPQIWKLSNIGQQPHVMYMVKTPRLLTMDEVMQLLQLPENATPPPGLPNPAEIENVGGMTIMSAGRTAWMAFDLQPGYYVAICYIPDKESHQPHAALGMVSVFTVGGGAAPGATPATSPESGASAPAVEIKGFAFNPATITVPVGTTVTWTNQDAAPHTATADDKSFDTGRLDQGQSGSVTFDMPGTYTYTCTFHPNMKGTVVVT
jgi:plastocyanin